MTVICQYAATEDRIEISLTGCRVVVERSIESSKPRRPVTRNSGRRAASDALSVVFVSQSAETKMAAAG